MLSRIASLLKVQPPTPYISGLLSAFGLTVPTNGTAGYETGCVFRHTDGGAETALYVNEGTQTSCAFVPVLTTSVEIADAADVGALAYTAGSILVGDGNSYEEVAVSGDATLAATGALTVTGIDNAYEIITSAAPSTTRLIKAELTVTPATDVAVAANGSLVAIRGCTTLTTGKSISDGYLYGVQGKFVGDGATIDVGSDHVAGVLAQMSGASMVATSGHIAIIVASGQSLPDSDQINGIYVESGGGTINAILQANCKATFAFDINNFESCGIVATPTGSTPSGDLRTLKVQIDGATYYLLAAAVYSS